MRNIVLDMQELSRRIKETGTLKKSLITNL